MAKQKGTILARTKGVTTQKKMGTAAWNRAKKNSKGTWLVRIYLGSFPVKGNSQKSEQKFEYRTVKGTYATAEKVRDEMLLTTLTSTTVLIDPKWKVKDLVEEWVEMQHKRALAGDISMGTWDLDRDSARNHVIPAFGNVPVKDLGSKQIERQLIVWRGQYSQSTLDKNRGILNKAFKWALSHHMVKSNPLVDIQLDRQKKKRIVKSNESVKSSKRDSLTEEQSHILLELVRGTAFHVLFALMLECGLRVGEACAICYEDVLDGKDVDREPGTKWLKVNATVNRFKGKRVPGQLINRFELGPPKTVASNRLVPVSDEWLELLEAHRVREQVRESKVGSHKKALKYWEQPNDENDPEHLKHTPETGEVKTLVFRSRDGLMMKPDCPRHELKKSFITMGLPQLKSQTHILRHTCASITITNNVGAIQSLSEMLGHEDVEITLKKYAHLLATDERTALETMNKVLYAGRSA